MSKTNITASGAGSKAAGGNIIENHITYNNIIFDPQDLADVLNVIYDNIDVDSNHNSDSLPINDFTQININEKNAKNGISAEFYNTYIKNDVIFFGKIDKVLKNPQNKQIKDKYFAIVKKISPSVFSKQEKGERLQDILDAIFDYFFIANKNYNGSNELVQILAYYTYHNCYIGRK